MAETFEIYKTRIKEILRQSGKKSVPFKTLYGKCKGRKNNLAEFKRAVSALEASGDILETKGGFKLTAASGLFKAEVSRINKTFGFIVRDDGSEVFVPGKFLLGAMPGDTVLARLIPTRGERHDTPDGEVVEIIGENFSEFTGVAERYGGGFAVFPDSLAKEPITVTECAVNVKDGDKVLAEICKRGKRHSDHRARITAVFGDSECAVSSAEAILYMNGVETSFPNAVLDEARLAEHMGIPNGEAERRLDLRNEVIFTIDGADTKDIDDAVSLKRLEDGWELGVHIADVSFYVKRDSELDKDAFRRGTSIYYANKVVPMLPKELSNGICSLNPREERLAFSCIMRLDGDGRLVKYKFSKSVIISRVKGVYSEVNKILEAIETGTEIPAELAEKYNGVTDAVAEMQRLAEILTANKIRRGAPQIETAECKLILDENEACVDVVPRERGKSELIIEEFMLMANTAAAKTAKENGIPFVYRVHERPAPEKTAELLDVAARMNIKVPDFSEIKAKHLAEILEKTKESPLSPVINSLVLRSMAKAKYSEEPLGHFGLVLDDYAHFTSPIRRYPDLAIHRILTDLCYNKVSAESMRKRYAAFAHSASEQSSAQELTAMRVERDCSDCYIAEYMKAHLGEDFCGMIVSVQEFGFFVQLPNTVEGLVRIDSLKDGPYDFDGHFTLTKNGQASYTVGDKVHVVCAGANVSSGQVDFTIAEEY
ncbi:MAG: ribonuclease R [Oscillospiraceae bacterium]|nr:ribonuclease R [Oscillospiraceae bacterium]